MNADRDRRILHALVSARAFLRAEGNPYHDPATGQFTGPGGSSGRHERRKRRRLRKARRILAAHRKDMAAMRARHKADRREVVRDQEADHAQLRRDQRAERKELRRDQRGERKELRREQAAEVREFGRDKARELRQIDRYEVNALKHAPSDEHAAIREEHAGLRDFLEKEHADNLAWAAEQHPIARKELRASQREARDDQGWQHADERAQKRREHREGRAEVRESQRDERRELIEQTADELADHGFRPRRKGAGDAARSGLAVLVHGRTDAGRISDMPGVDRRLSPGRTHKASEAGAILRHCLRGLGRGWLRRFRRGELTERQRITLLDAVREYGRAWLRHEAEGLIRHYGRAVDGPDDGGGRALDHAPGVRGGGPADGQARGLTQAMRRHVGRFFDRARNFVRELIVAGSMALNGPGELDDHDLAAIDRQAQVQVAYLDRFRGDVEMHTPPELAIVGAPPDPEAMTAAQFVARAEQYAGSTWGDAINARREKVKSGRKMKWERRVHAKPMGQHDACTTCAGESAKGWVPIGVLSPIGDSECKGINCDCYFQYAEERPAA